jgi:hypothetical protein
MPKPVEVAGAEAELTGPTDEPQQAGKVHLIGLAG